MFPALIEALDLWSAGMLGESDSETESLLNTEPEAEPMNVRRESRSGRRSVEVFASEPEKKIEQDKAITEMYGHLPGKRSPSKMGSIAEAQIRGGDEELLRGSVE